MWGDIDIDIYLDGDSFPLYHCISTVSKGGASGALALGALGQRAPNQREVMLCNRKWGEGCSVHDLPQATKCLAIALHCIGNSFKMCLTQCLPLYIQTMYPHTHIHLTKDKDKICTLSLTNLKSWYSFV